MSNRNTEAYHDLTEQYRREAKDNPRKIIEDFGKDNQGNTWTYAATVRVDQGKIRGVITKSNGQKRTMLKKIDKERLGSSNAANRRYIDTVLKSLHDEATKKAAVSGKGSRKTTTSTSPAQPKPQHTKNYLLYAAVAGAAFFLLSKKRANR